MMARMSGVVAIVRSRSALSQSAIDRIQRAFGDTGIHAIVVDGLDVEIVKPPIGVWLFAAVGVFAFGAAMGWWLL